MFNLTEMETFALQAEADEEARLEREERRERRRKARESGDGDGDESESESESEIESALDAGEDASGSGSDDDDDMADLIGDAARLAGVAGPNCAGFSRARGHRRRRAKSSCFRLFRRRLFVGA